MKMFYFSIFITVFFNTQLAFVFHGQEDFRIIRNHILAFYFFYFSERS